MCQVSKTAEKLNRRLSSSLDKLDDRTNFGVFPVHRLPIRRLPIRRLPIRRLNKNCPRPYRPYGPKRMNFVFSLGDFV